MKYQDVTLDESKSANEPCFRVEHAGGVTNYLFLFLKKSDEICEPWRETLVCMATATTAQTMKTPLVGVFLIKF